MAALKIPMQGRWKQEYSWNWVDMQSTNLANSRPMRDLVWERKRKEQTHQAWWHMPFMYNYLCGTL